MLQGVHPKPSRSLGADAHEAVADCQLFVDKLVSHAKRQAVITLFTGTDSPPNLALASHAGGSGNGLKCARGLKINLREGRLIIAVERHSDDHAFLFALLVDRERPQLIPQGELAE